LQDLKIADRKRTKTEKPGLENDGANRRAGKWRTLIMTDPISMKVVTLFQSKRRVELKELRMGIKFGQIVLEVNTHPWTKSDI